MKTNGTDARHHLKWLGLALLLGAALAHQSVDAAEFVAPATIVTDRELDPGATHGLGKIMEALRVKSGGLERVAALELSQGRTLLVCGLASDSGAAARLLKDWGAPAPTEPEALVIHHGKWQGKPALLVCGADDRGLMYAELDVADRIGWAANPRKPLSEVRDIREQPAASERALTKFVMNKSEFERYCFSEEYWRQYLDMLAANRFNTFHLLFGYFTQGYFEPIYPYMFDVEGFPGIRVVGLTPEQQRRNLEMLNTIVRLTHERGLNFTLGP